MDRKVQEIEIQHNLSKLEQQYECAICLNWLDEPTLTRCGHRFCKKCIEPCLKTNKPCPIDNTPLNDSNIFPDNFTRREISQMMVSCPYEAKGCQKRMSPYESDGHVVSCEYRPKSTAGGISSPTPPCLFKSCGCTFKTTDPDKLAAHLQSDMATHLNLLLASFNQKKAMAFKSIEAEKLWDAPSKSTDGQNGSSTDDHSNDALLSALYERIVVLEQMSREQGLKIDKLTTQLNRSVTSFSEMSARHSGGILLWQITNFTSKVEEMRNSASTMYYSPDVFTGPFGYRFCARISVSPKAMHSIALYLHMMRSENDYHLDWPFRGCLKFWMINNCDSNLTQHDKIMTNEKAMAFARPQMNISPRGFGFLEYAAISDIYGRGFLRNDTLTIKFHIGIV